MKTTVDFLKMKQEQEIISMITAYDAPTAKIVEEAGVDLILVGDSVGMVVHGYDGTQPVTMEDMILHSRAVRRGAKDTFIVVDMPFMTYHGSLQQTIDGARSLVQTGGAQAVKMEGCSSLICDSIEQLSLGGIPVMGHLGLTPQSSTVLGGFRVQGRDDASAEKMIADSKKLEQAGAFALVLECVPESLTSEIRKTISIPVIGIGAGEADGQVLVFHDVVGLTDGHVPKFVKMYADVASLMKEAVLSYNRDVKTKSFPETHHKFSIKKKRVSKSGTTL